MQSNSSDSSQPQQQQEQNQRPQQQQQQQQPHPQQHPQWMAMQYPAAAMVMQHQMMPPQHYSPSPQHYMAYHQYQQHHPHQQLPGSGGSENKTIWVGDLHHWMDENYLHNCFASTGEISSIKIIRNKQTGLSEGYGFVEFFSHATAEKVLQNYTGILMPNTDLPFRLNWATFSTGEKRSDNNASDLSIFVGDLAADVTDRLLHETFASKYPSVKAAKVVFDANTGRSKGYGFVRFGDDSERTQAMTEMNGVYCSSRPMRIGAATPRKSSGYNQHGGYAPNGASTQGFQSEGDSSNTTKLNGTVIGKQTFRGDFGNQWSGAYYGGHVYDNYGYALPPHDPTMYPAAYGAYPMYGSHQQQKL
ncbi:hypothetical protein G4B88_018822 [Cannabis sativa]|uniref:RRM domain-containing protein n=1 Tax=Cannabis sativa TaxID=3483 RepID=A0A7J6EBQ9_CANSA|nr:hypothetical protein G4B88_018822 [Cannabis sativa]